MDENTLNQTVSPVETASQPTSNLITNQRGNLLIILGILILLLVVGGGAYYLGTQNARPAYEIMKNSSNPTNNRATQTTTSPNPTESTNSSEETHNFPLYPGATFLKKEVT